MFSWSQNFPLRLALQTAALLTAVMLAAVGAAYLSAVAVVHRAVAQAPPAVLPQRALEGEQRQPGPEAGRREGLRDRESREHELDEVLEWEMQLLGQLRAWLAAVAVAGIGLVSGVSWFTVRRAFRPVERIASTAAGIAGSSRIDAITLATRVPPPGISDRTLQRLSDAINAMLDRLQRAFEGQRRFVDDAAHELRTPLAALRSAWEVALRRARSPEEYRQALQTGLEQIARLSRMADQMLDLARYEAGPSPVSVRPGVALAPVVEEVLAQLASLAEARGVTLGGDVDAALRLDADPLALERLLLNLVRNGIEATPAGGAVTVTAAVVPPPGVRQPAGAVAITVSDTGRGIPPEAMDGLFERFRRVDRGRSRQAGEGFGLGLAICKAIAGAHGGEIRVESTPGRGSRFTVVLPLRQEDH